MTALRKDHHALSLQRASGFALSLITLGFAALIPTAARAQTQDLFAANGIDNTISRFAGTGPGTFSTTATTLSDPSSTLSQPQGLAFDGRGDLFVANAVGNSITEFASTGAGTFAAGKIVETGLNSPRGLAFDAGGDLFAANFNNSTNGSITEFPSGGAGAFATGKTFANGNIPIGLAFDAGGDLFAANFNNNNGTITEFSSTGAGTFGAIQTVETGLHSLSFLTFGPSVPPAVPEASTTVSLGLLLALGIGGLVAAKKRRKA